MENGNNGNAVRGFKVFNEDWTCSPGGNTKQYTCPGKFKENGDIEVCKNGMHFCEDIADCFDYYGFDSRNKVAEVIAYGKVVKEEDMTEQEKTDNPECATAGGYLKVVDGAGCAQEWWDGLREHEKDAIRGLPNFNPEIFRECTGIDMGSNTLVKESGQGSERR